MALIGYARVSTEDQNLSGQLDALRAAGCDDILEEHASGASRERPQLAHALARVRKGDTLVVARIDRLARSLAHLLEIVETLRGRGAHFRSLRDPIDTTGPSGVLVLQMLGAVAEFERSLIRERTKAGIAAAKARGRVGGHPGMRSRDPEAQRQLLEARRAKRIERLLPHLDEWLPVVTRLRPAQRWEAVMAAVNAALPHGRPRFTEKRLTGTVRLLVREGMVDAALLARAPRPTRRKGDGQRHRTMELAASFVSGKPRATLAEVGAELARMKVQPESGRPWAPSSVKALLDRARVAGMLTPRNPG